jgi:hypothetical protein
MEDSYGVDVEWVEREIIRPKTRMPGARNPSSGAAFLI